MAITMTAPEIVKAAQAEGADFNELRTHFDALPESSQAGVLQALNQDAPDVAAALTGGK